MATVLHGEWVCSFQNYAQLEETRDMRCTGDPDSSGSTSGKGGSITAPCTNVMADEGVWQDREIRFDVVSA